MNLKLSTIIASAMLLAGPMATKAQTTEPIPTYLDDNAPIEKRVDDALSRMTLREKISILHAQSKFSARGVPRLGLPDLWTDDGPHGVRADVVWDKWEQAGQTNDSCVAFPALTCLAASWSTPMAYLYGKSLGEEALYRGKDMILAPGVNILRTPLCGRNFEYLGEDPYLASEMVVPYVEGIQSNGVSACVKHFALNNDEEYRSEVNVKLSDRTLREIYLPPFEAAVRRAHVWALMGAYGIYKDQHECHNDYLLNKILKQEWQFDGVVVSDWGGAHDTYQAANYGLDLEFGTHTNGLNSGASNAYSNYYLADPYLKGIVEGKYSMEGLNDKVRRVLRLYFRTTMAKRGHGSLCSESHYDAARKIAEEGIVLLKNDGNTLPISLQQKPNPTVLVVGENAIKMMTVGGGSSSLKAQKEISPLQGLQKRLSGVATVEFERGYVGDLSGSYNGVTTGQDLNDKRSEQQLISDAVAKAKTADYVIVFGGLNKSDYQDAEGHDRKQYELPYAQDKLMEQLAKVTKKLVYVNISGNPAALPWLKKVPAVVQGWFLGSEAGEALAAVLCGDVNPSGKLPFTWPASLHDVGAHALGTYPGTWRQPGGIKTKGNIIDEEYKEGIYVGYRWADQHNTHPLFAFGHGLSYTTFALSNLRLSSPTISQDDSLTVTVTVKNTGKRAGAEVVQLYIHDDKASVDRPYKELKGFGKVALAPGEQRDVNIKVGRRAFSFYDEARQEWRSEPGKFTLLVGNASDNLRLKTSLTLKD